MGCLTPKIIDFLNIFGVVGIKKYKLMCAEGALNVKRPFPGSKVGRGGSDDYKTPSKIYLQTDP